MESAFTHIACCIDDSEASMQARDEARRLVGDGGTLTLVHVVYTPVVYAEPLSMVGYDPGFIYHEAQKWLDERVAEVPGATGVLLEGHPPSAVCRWAETAEPDLIVAASHRGLVARVLLGSFAAHLAQHSPVDVLLTRPRNITAEGADDASTD